MKNSNSLPGVVGFRSVGAWWSNLRGMEKLAILALGIYAAMQLFAPFYLPVDGHDSPVHLSWIDAFYEQMRRGVWYPRWLPDSYAGFGSPTFYFYPPLGYFAGALLRFILPSLDAVAVFHILGSISTVISFIGFRKFLRHFKLSTESATLGGLLYAFAPYRFFDLYIRGALGEHLAFAILPFLFLAAERLLAEQPRSMRGFRSLALLWAMLLMTNIPSAALAGLALPLYLLIRCPKRAQSKLLKPATALVLGTSCASIYLFPVLHFYPYLSQALFAGQLPGYSTGNAILDLILGKNLMSNRIYCSLMLGSVLLFLRSPREIGSTLSFEQTPEFLRQRGFRVLLALALLLQLPYITIPLFEKLLPFTLIQFTWRWDVIVVLASAILLAIFWERKQRRIALLLILGWSVVGATLLPFTAAGVHMRYLAKREIVEPGDYQPPAVAGRVTPELLRAHEKEAILIADDTSLHILIDDSGTVTRHMVISASHNVKLTMHRFVWPQWRISSDNVELPIAADSLARITTNLAPGTHAIQIVLAKSTSEESGSIVSLISLGLVLLLPSVFRRTAQRSNRGRDI